MVQQEVNDEQADEQPEPVGKKTPGRKRKSRPEDIEDEPASDGDDQEEAAEPARPAKRQAAAPEKRARYKLVRSLPRDRACATAGADTLPCRSSLGRVRAGPARSSLSRWRTSCATST